MAGLSVQELRQDAAGIQQSVAYIHSLVQAEIDAGTPSERIVLGGFSQGGGKPPAGVGSEGSLFLGVGRRRPLGPALRRLGAARPVIWHLAGDG